MRLLELKEDKSYQPPSIDVGDEVLVGKFKNRRAEVKGFTTDDNNQPVLKTSKGDQHLFKPRIAKLMPTDVNEDSGNSLQTIIQSFVNSPIGQKYKQHDCKTVTRAFVRWAEQNKIPTQVVSLAPPSADFIAKNPQFKGKSGEGDSHIMPIMNGSAIDFTVRQFGVKRPFENPLVTLINSLPAVYGKFGYFTDNPDWFPGGKSHWIGALNAIPPVILNQNFGDEMLEQGVAEGSLGTVLPWPEVVNKVNSAMKAMGWKGQRKADGSFMFSTKGQLDDEFYIVIIDNEGNSMFTYALGTVEEGDPHIGEQDTLPTTEASVSELMNAIQDGFGLNENFTDGRNPEDKGDSKRHGINTRQDIDSAMRFAKQIGQQGVAENFADGRVKGKSRPGRVKRSGASCDGSVSDLRSKAKNTSGERAKMYHWCANMKNGRAKTESEMLEDLNAIWKDVLEAGVYKGYPCTKDCSGHAAGDRWADARNITDPNLCPYSNNSFWEGCLAHTDEQE